jgi:hypothetical protein
MRKMMIRSKCQRKKSLRMIELVGPGAVEEEDRLLSRRKLSSDNSRAVEEGHPRIGLWSQKKKRARSMMMKRKSPTQLRENLHQVKMKKIGNGTIGAISASALEAFFAVMVALMLPTYFALD